MKSLALFFLVLSFPLSMVSQPGNGNGYGHGNGNGSGNCGNPPCGGPHQTVPVDVQWLLYAGLVAGVYLKFQFRKKDVKS